ncbi:MAG: glycogen synthase GlgA [Clostridia bacterium]|nr:glycogen synthase GlgA [Clostridia bacterium]
MKVLYVASECVPFAKTGGLGDVAGALPSALIKEKVDCRVVLPFYSVIPEKYKSTMHFLGSITVPVSWRNQYCGIFTQIIDGVQYYFLDNEYYFKREGLYGYYDDAERFAFFSRAVLEVMSFIDFFPDVLHCNDWHTALCPVYLDAIYADKEGYRGMKTVFTIHNIEFQGKYGKDILEDVLGLPEYKDSLVDYSYSVNFMKGAIEASNVVTTVSNTYAQEILDPYYAYGLADILRAREYKLRGVVNGIDTSLYNPRTDKSLFKRYTKSTANLKAENKKALFEMLGLCLSEKTALVGMVTRLTEQKGMDLVMAVAEEMLTRDIALVVLGTGDWRFESGLKELERKYPNKVRSLITFSADLANKIYSASDIFLMPSKFEPCGLSQLIAMRYGSIPVVRETGGLKDTVIPFDETTMEGTGFTFKSFDAYDMLGAVDRALSLYSDEDKWEKIRINAMKVDSTWSKSAKQYKKIYNELRK